MNIIIFLNFIIMSEHPFKLSPLRLFTTNVNVNTTPNTNLSINAQPNIISTIDNTSPFQSSDELSNALTNRSNEIPDLPDLQSMIIDDPSPASNNIPTVTNVCESSIFDQLSLICIILLTILLLILLGYYLYNIVNNNIDISVDDK